jgi:hypothetical protein
MTTQKAELKPMSPYAVEQHGLDNAKVSAIMVAIDDTYAMPPVLMVDRGNERLILDGHHRAAAARRLGYDSIPAWVISDEQYQAILDEHFAGSAPVRLADLDEYIVCDNTKYRR